MTETQHREDDSEAESWPDPGAMVLELNQARGLLDTELADLARRVAGRPCKDCGRPITTSDTRAMSEAKAIGAAPNLSAMNDYEYGAPGLPAWEEGRAYEDIPELWHAYDAEGTARRLTRCWPCYARVMVANITRWRAEREAANRRVSGQ